ncbi:hypothetical protein NDU88_002268 [Pleurodeles waltl]|uniref:Uncharacterized protein n=1 Tax=Pleurodeles waltl TaxID=8319 RepID=A0AAV7UA02_PLEWA|nr:hypothetical protein NDU88_002268 [Pleurodeles waltl]
MARGCTAQRTDQCAKVSKPARSEATAFLNDLCFFVRGRDLLLFMAIELRPVPKERASVPAQCGLVLVLRDSDLGSVVNREFPLLGNV